MEENENLYILHKSKFYYEDRFYSADTRAFDNCASALEAVRKIVADHPEVNKWICSDDPENRYMIAMHGESVKNNYIVAITLEFVKKES